ncbi:MAG: Tfp pilus assembly protein PilV [Phycisphaerales bacterium]|nr:Tfp pilus assembly protein PilV [Phycisphaerales bacterium]
MIPKTPADRPRRRPPSAARGRGFTLIEAAWVTMIIGVGVIAMMELLAAGTVSNAASNQMTVAVNLANNVHEISLGLAYADPAAPTQWSTREATVAAYDDVADLDGQTFSPPLDVRRQPIAGYPNWAQRVTVRTVSPDAVTAVRPNDITVPTARVTVEILLNGKVVHTATWLVVGPSPG